MRNLMLAAGVLAALLPTAGSAAEQLGAVKLTVPEHASVLLDGGLASAPKAASGGLRLLVAPEGQHLVTVEVPGEETVSRVVRVDGGRTVELAWGREGDRDGRASRPILAAVPHCLSPRLPKPQETAETPKAASPVAEHRRVSDEPARTPPVDPQVGDTSAWTASSP